MTRLYSFFITILATCTFLTANAQTTSNAEITMLPYPQMLTPTEGVFCVSGATFNYGKGLDKNAVKDIEKFASRFGAKAKKVGVVQEGGFNFVVDGSLESEAYTLDINTDKVVVKAGSREGFFYAIQTLKQLLPVEVYGSEGAAGQDWTLSCMSISDRPRYGYRGLNVDVCRHFYGVDQIKKFIDLMAVYKLNRLHLHLTDDQGWRIEIKKYPKLTEVGAYREGTQIGKDFDNHDGKRYGGYYTQKDLKEIIKYAQEHCITVIPEIDLPGHMVAALASYPEMGCTGGPYSVWTQWGVSEKVLCPAKDATWTFLKDVLAEVAALFPSEYIHIGGDECPVKEWEKCPECQAMIKELGLTSDKESSAERKLQYHVMKEIQAYLKTKGKKVIGWQEIFKSNLDEGGVIMSWTSRSVGVRAAKAGTDVIMAPSFSCYLDCRQSNNPDEPLSCGSNGNRPVTVKNCYDLDPSVGIPADKQKHILGTEICLWTEYISTPEHLEYMLLPRMAAFSEVGWTELENKSLDRLKTALKEHQFKIYEILNFNYRSALDF